MRLSRANMALASSNTLVSQDIADHIRINLAPTVSLSTLSISAILDSENRSHCPSRVRVGLDTATELTPSPVKVILWLLGPNVIWAACAPDPQSAASPMVIRSLVFIAGLSKGIVFPCFMDLAKQQLCHVRLPKVFKSLRCIFAPSQPQM